MGNIEAEVKEGGKPSFQRHAQEWVSARVSGREHSYGMYGYTDKYQYTRHQEARYK